MRATTSLPEPVGPRISTEMSDLAAVRIHSKMASIFSSRPIISRKRCTDGDASSMPRLARPSRNVSSSLATASLSGLTAANVGGSPAIFLTTPKSTSSLMQLSTSRRIRPNVCMINSDSNASSGRALRKRRMPARSGDCTSDLNRASRSGTSGFGAADPARRAAKVTSSTGHLGLSAVAKGFGATSTPAGGPAVILRLVLLDQLLQAQRIALAMAVTAHGRLPAARFDEHVREQQVGVDLHGSHMRNMDRMFFSADHFRRVVHDGSRGNQDLRRKQAVAARPSAGAEHVAFGKGLAFPPEEQHERDANRGDGQGRRDNHALRHAMMLLQTQLIRLLLR